VVTAQGLSLLLHPQLHFTAENKKRKIITNAPKNCGDPNGIPLGALEGGNQMDMNFLVSLLLQDQIR